MKRRFLSLALAIIFVLTLVPPVEVHANQIRVTFNGQNVAFPDQGPVIRDGRTLVPIAPVINAINASNPPTALSSEWRGDTRQVVVRRGNDNLTLTIGSRTIATQVGGRSDSVTIDVPAQIIGGRTMVPLAAVLDVFGFNVTWNGAASTVVVTDSRNVATTAPAPTPTPAAPAAPAATPRQMAEAMIASQGGIPGMVPLLHGQAFFNEYLSDNYRISPNSIRSGVIFYVDFALVDDMPADEIAVFELAAGANSTEVANALRSYIQRRASIFAGYAPDSAAVASRGIVVYRDNFIAMIICDNPQAAEAAFLALF